jgi:uncharacterized membrane protein
LDKQQKQAKQGPSKGIVRLLLSGVFISSGVLHFTATKEYLKITPPALPATDMLVYISGVCEVLGGVGLFIPKVRRSAGLGLAALLLAVFPANVYHAMSKVQVASLPNSPIYHIIRLPMQFVLIWAVLWSSRTKKTADDK